jgi:hypothetical protein
MAAPRTPKKRRRQTVNFIDDRNAVALRFADEETSHKAVGIILAKAPDHPFLYPDLFTIIMNAEDKSLFDGLAYDTEEVAKPGEVSNEELSEARYENLFGGKKKV